MTELKTCRICFDDENQDELISPCGCTGSMKFVHKDCLNNWLQCNKGNKRYKECNECKKKYNRLEPSGQDEAVNFQMSSYVFCLTIASSLVLVMLLFLSGLSVILCTVILLILYIVTLTCSLVANNNYVSWFLIFVFIVAMFSPRKIKTFVTDIWLILGYGLLTYNYVSNSWEDTRECISSNYISNLKPMMFDYHSNRYVDGVF